MLGEWRSDQVQIGAANSDWALAPFKLSVRLIGLVHLHGGDVAIQSRIGEGTRVTVRLPLEGGSGTSTGDLIKFPSVLGALQ